MRWILRLGWLLLLMGAAGVNAAPDPRLDLTAHRGKIVVVDFWASWCGPCRQSFPWLNEMQTKYAGQGLVVIGVNVDPTREEATRFLDSVPARFGIVYDPEGQLATQYQVPGMPSSYIFGPDGALLDKHIGFRTSDRATREAQLQKLLGTLPKH